MVVSKTFRVNSAIDTSENATYSLVNDSYENQATLVIFEEQFTIYFANGEPERKFVDFMECMSFINENEWIFVKLLSGKCWKDYNPNPQERNIGDCTLRSYCAAFDISWDEAFDIASKIAKENASMIQYVSSKVLTDHFNCTLDEKYNKKTVKAADRMTVNEFTMSHPYGTYILHVRSHQVTVRNGQYWDSWDCGNKKVDEVYLLPDNK